MVSQPILTIAIVVLILIVLAITMAIIIPIVTGKEENIPKKVCKETFKHIDPAILAFLNIRPSEIICNIILPG